MTILAFFAFLSGIATILSPCILPVLPIILSGSIGGKRKPIGVVAGFVFSFSIFTLILSTLVQALSIPPDTLRVVAIAVIIGFGSVLVIPPLQQKFELLASRMVSRKQGRQRSGFGGGLLVGASLGMLWTPCVGPIMASVISLAVSRQVDGGSVIIVLAYSAGTAVPMLAVMLGGRKLLNRFPGLTASTGKIQRIFGIIMIAAGISIGFGLDRRFQAFVLDVFPNYGTGLTSFEDNEFIRRALDRRAGGPESEDEDGLQPMSYADRPLSGQLDDFGQAPEIITGGRWFNSDPLTMEELRGKVVLVDFWTYSCVNCVRTLPYLHSWYETYRDRGFEIIGVHSPEFAFERDPENVRRAVEELGVGWPVVLDNDFEQWRLYNNRYWPAHYFIDAEGRIRYYHYGEGEYETSEEVIRKLLEEAGNDAGALSGAEEWEGLHSETPEIYLGYRRFEGFVDEDASVYDEFAQFSIDAAPGIGEWALSGEWSITAEYAELRGEGSLELGFNSKDVFLVIEPLEDEAFAEVFIDGEPEQIIAPRESRLYQLASFGWAGERRLRLNLSGNMRLYAFTFG